MIQLTKIKSRLNPYSIYYFVLSPGRIIIAIITVAKQHTYNGAYMPKPNLQLIYVSDINRSTELYKTLFNENPVFRSPRYVAFSAGEEAFFALWTGGTKPDTSVPRFSEIGILLSSNEAVNQLFEIWKNNSDLTIVKAPYTEVFGRTFMVRDPDGHLIRVSPLD